MCTLFCQDWALEGVERWAINAIVNHQMHGKKHGTGILMDSVIIEEEDSYGTGLCWAVGSTSPMGLGRRNRSL